MDRKFELVGEPRTVSLADGSSRKVYRIKALRDFADIQTGQMGGWIEKEENLSQVGDCFVYDEAVVVDSAVVKGQAKIRDCAVIMDKAIVEDAAVVMNHAVVKECARVMEWAQVSDEALVSGRAIVSGNAAVKDTTFVFENAEVSGYARIIDDAIVKGQAVVKDMTVVMGNSIVMGDVVVKGQACITEGYKINGKAVVDSDKENKSKYEMDIKERVGAKILKARVRKGYSIRHLGEITGISYSNIGKLERGCYNPSIVILNKLCEALDVELLILDKED